MSALRVEGLVVRGRERPRLDRVSVAFEPGRLTVLVGPNGAGKSTLLRVLAGLEAPHRGQVSVGERPWSALSRAERAATVAWMPQVPRLEEGLTAEQVVAAARYRFHEPAPAARRHALQALHALGAARHAQTPMAALSGGEAQRVRLASLAAQEAAWWLLDEPGNHLDAAVRFDLVDIVRKRVAGGEGVVLVTHDLAMIPLVGQATVLALDDGKLVHASPAEDPALPQILGRIFGVALRSVDVDGGRWVVVGRQP